MSETINEAIARVLRELPDTDKDRYDIAYRRGRAQARSSLLFGGLALGTLIGAAGMFFLDPASGERRRHEAGRQFVGRRNDLARMIDGRIRDLRNRAKGAGIESGVVSPPDESRGESARTMRPTERPPVAGDRVEAMPERATERAGDREPVLARQWTAGATLGESSPVEAERVER